MLNAILLETSSDQVSPLSLHLLNIVSIEGNSPALQNLFILSGCFLSMTMMFPQKKQCNFQLNLLISSDRKNILKFSLVSKICIEDEDFLKEFVKSHLQFLSTRRQENSWSTCFTRCSFSSAFAEFDETV